MSTPEEGIIRVVRSVLISLQTGMQRGDVESNAAKLVDAAERIRHLRPVDSLEG